MRSKKSLDEAGLPPVVVTTYPYWVVVHNHFPHTHPSSSMSTISNQVSESKTREKAKDPRKRYLPPAVGEKRTKRGILEEDDAGGKLADLGRQGTRKFRTWSQETG